MCIVAAHVHIMHIIHTQVLALCYTDTIDIGYLPHGTMGIILASYYYNSLLQMITMPVPCA